jgi:hypothetical protein
MPPVLNLLSNGGFEGGGQGAETGEFATPLGIKPQAPGHRLPARHARGVPS